MSCAAENINVTKTSLSLQIKDLEALVEGRLLVRHSRGVTATAKGTAFYENAAAVLELVDETERLFLKNLANSPRILRIGVTPSVARMVGLEVISAANTRLKDTSLSLDVGWTAEMIPKLVSSDLDIIIAHDLSKVNDLVVKNFFPDEFLFICRPGDLEIGCSVDFQAVVGSNLVFYGDSNAGLVSVGLRAIREAAAEAGLSFPGAREVMSIDVWRRMVASGLGTSVAPRHAVDDEVRRGEISSHRMVGLPIIRNVGMMAHPDTLRFVEDSGFFDLLSELLDPGMFSGGPEAE